ncbi:PTS system D-mannose-specific IIA component, Fru family /PTS system D-mannose-specific IIB component, Fru family /PTS system D-mannose-specific IIC component, Fru family [Pelagirhabdus alkalitolerans]|uniref:PTS system D-mannose-specific IIA component, Fru family /PTS system D-mannose-specific IIB component, Fru family /PTS system D-mannose-specific IIC component, Fru family n=1 Tax=Pelagirhabdus alkalitolerans TaxID=1612202 RepID=A0A1G6KZ66_9BACI|nr:PTS fructose transporter subunit IIABC [Pelagirhabdus alkalitolerans]SDC36111.1 PTS system D-mannose-specific IIA component, Fru family /PTS system D-mannose-specific IIB component, Fru family /PTS system D-mannose-specific IIC component, Fru family [Pelagirhabdus alkalitolerans]
MKLVAITSCPNGIAHTYMAAENLEKAAEKLDVDISVETQGGVGVENELSQEAIDQADGVIIAADKTVNKERFIGKKLISTGVQEGIRNPESLIKQFETGNVKEYRGTDDGDQMPTRSSGDKQNPIYRHLMNGVSFMVPFIVVGGLLIAISLTLGGVPGEEGIAIPDDSFWATIEAIGGAAFSFMVPILAGYIAYSIADKPGLAPGMIGGYIAANGALYGSPEAEAGFLGGIIAGFLAGYVALLIKRIKVHKMIQPIMPIIIIPVATTLIVSLLFVLFIGNPVASIFAGLTDWLEGMQGTSSVVLALILGAMIAFDMGGPVNKVAFMFGSAMIVEGNYGIMGPIGAAIAIPPIGMGLATFMFKQKFLPEQRETGKASITMGFFGITEGAIPFAAQDPLRVIPSIIVGSMAGSVVAMLSGVGNQVAHGGPIVGLLGAVDNVLMFFVAIAIGSVVVAFMIKVLKKDVDVEPVSANETPVKATPASADRHETEETGFQKLTDITNLGLIEPQLKETTRDDVIDTMIDRLVEDGAVTEKDAFKSVILEREQEGTTGIGMNVAIPHGKSDVVKEPKVVFGIQNEGVDWHSTDGSLSKLIFMIAVPKDREGDDHLKILQMLSRKLMDDDFRQQLLSVKSKEEAYQLLDEI